MVVDAGNVVVHLFLPATRRQYDLEMLWTGLDLDEWVALPPTPAAPSSAVVTGASQGSDDGTMPKAADPAGAARPSTDGAHT